MLYNKEKKFLFIHIGKNAGSTIKEALPGIKYGWKDKPHTRTGIHPHATAVQARKFFKNWDDLYKFGFVRNPWDRLYSIYSYWTNTWHKSNATRLKLRSKSFKQWLMHEQDYMWWSGEKILTEWDKYHRNPIRDYKLKLPHQRCPQTTWLYVNGKCIVDFVGRVETLQQDYETVCKNVKVEPIDLSYENSSERELYQSVYDDEMIKFVEKYHKDDIDAFGYTF